MTNIVPISHFVPLVYGNTADPIPEEDQAENSVTHKWKVYLKSAAEQDLSKIFKKVVFKLHESFKNSNRTLTGPPYEVLEAGWGEFEIQIKIYLHDPSESPITIFHFLKLYPDNEMAHTLEGGNTVVAEAYDELVLPNPSPHLEAALASLQPRKRNVADVSGRDYEAEEEKQLAAIETAKMTIEAKISALQAHHAAAEAGLQRLKTEK